MSETEKDGYSQVPEETEEPRRQRELCGALFINRKKKRKDQPDRTGTCTIGGVQYRMAGWIKLDGNGNAYLSMSFSVPTKREEI